MELLAYFFERDDAEAVADALGGEVRRGRFQGEDDDEDHPWMVVLPDGADPGSVERLLTQYDGWLESAEAEPHPAPPALPTAPQRLKKKAHPGQGT